jgi:hypothetical protein
MIQGCNSCNSHNNSDSYNIRFHIDEEHKKIYDDICSEYPKHFIDHLPEFYDSNNNTFEFVFPVGEYLSYIHLIMTYPPQKIDEIIKYAEENAIEKHYLNDSCLMMIAYKDDSNSVHDSTFLKQYKCKQYSSLPLPNFTWCIAHGFPSNSDFYKNATIYILGTEQGEFLKHTYTEELELPKTRDKRLLKSNKTGLPLGWEHGYTKGLLISGKYVFYWLDVW